jgi:hypothetical protein
VLLTELWLEDLFRVYLRVSEPLDRGPFQGRPTPYNPAQFSNPSDPQLQQTIEDKLRLKRAQEDVAVLGWYVRFVNQRTSVQNEPRSNTLRNWIRYPRVLVADRSEYERAKSAILSGLIAFERRHWAMQGDLAREGQVMGDRIAIWGAYSGALDSFNRAIRNIIALASESILNCPAVVKMEIDFTLHDSAMPGLTNSPYRFTAQASREAFRVWNALSPRQRSALVRRGGELGGALQEEYEQLHHMRQIDIPDP